MLLFLWCPVSIRFFCVCFFFFFFCFFFFFFFFLFFVFLFCFFFPWFVFCHIIIISCCVLCVIFEFVITLLGKRELALSLVDCICDCGPVTIFKSLETIFLTLSR